MNISISLLSPMGYVFGMYFIILINYFLSFGKSNIIKKIYVVISSVISIIGIVAALMIRPILMRKIDSPRFDNLVLGSLSRFDFYFQVSIIAILLISIFLVCLLLSYKKNENRALLSLFSFVIIVAMTINIMAGLCFSYETINKIFDVPSYVLALTLSEIAIFHVPLVVKRIILKKF